jgi:AraC-like DNA-binding protein/mannose-6-phosphate isomerase-like protein (cupin superfamily)
VQRFAQYSSGDSVRNLSTFQAFPEIQGLGAEELARWLQAVDVQSVSALEWKWGENWSVGPRVVKDAMWFCFLHGKGSGWIQNPKNKFRFEAGDLVLIPPGTQHFVSQDKRIHSHVIAVHFTAQIYGGFSLLHLIRIPYVLRSTRDLPLVKTSGRLAREFAVKAPAWRTAMDAEIKALLIAILRTHGNSCHAQMDSLAQLVRFGPVFELIEQQLSDTSLTVERLAQSVYLGEVQFRRLFRSMTEMTPASFLQRRRIEHACELLVQSELSVEDIAHRCGFAHSSFFYRVFRRWMSTTPHAYRSCRTV